MNFIKFQEFHKISWNFLIFYETLWNSMKFKPPWTSVDLRGPTWASVGLRGTIVFDYFSCVFDDFWWFLIFHDFWWFWDDFYFFRIFDEFSFLLVLMKLTKGTELSKVAIAMASPHKLRPRGSTWRCEECQSFEDNDCPALMFNLLIFQSRSPI